jgi:hypothetical protein
MDLAALPSLGSLLDLSNLPLLGPMMDAAVQQQFGQFPAFANAPFFLRFQALFPYAQGMSFIQKGLAQGGWAKLNQIFLNPPETTREIFSPQLYFSAAANGNRQSTKISLPRPKPFSSVTGLHFVAENNMGELGYYSIIGQLISEEEAKSVATLLTGDRYLVYENPDAHRYALVAVTRWASPEAALAFYRDYHTILTKRFLELTPDRRSTPDLFIGSTKSGEVLLMRKGDECVWAESVPEAQTDAMIDYLRSIQ